MKTRLRKPICVLMSVLIVTLPEMALAQQPGNKQQLQKQAIRLIPNDATAGLIAHPHSALTAPGMEAIPTEIISAFGKQELGFDPMNIELLVAAVNVPQGAIPSGAVALRFIEPISLEELSPNLTRGMSQGQLNDKPYLRSESGWGFYLPSDRVLFFGQDTMIRSMLKRDGTAEGEVQKYLLAGPASDLQLVVTLGSLRNMLNVQLQQAPPLPGGLEALKRLPNHTAAVGLSINTGPLSGTLALHAIDDEAGDEIEKIFARAINTGKLMALEAAKYNIQGDGEVEQASRAYAERMIGMIADSLAPAREGTKLVLGSEVGNHPEAAVIGTLVALLLPAVQSARQAARRAQAMNSGRQLILSLLNHESATGRIPAHAIYDEEGKKPLLSWRVKILPYIEESDLYEEFHLNEPWDSPHNKKLIARMPAVFAHDGADPTEGKTHFLGVAGKGESYLFRTDNSEGRRIGEISDGTSKSIAIVEADDAVVWTKPDDYMVDEDNPQKGLGGLRPGKIFNAFFCDGHASVTSKDVDGDRLKAMFTINGGEAVR